jgi:alpha-mannosidase
LVLIALSRTNVLRQTLENYPALSRFMPDGQAVLIEDYLEIKPENRDRLSRPRLDGRL